MAGPRSANRKATSSAASELPTPSVPRVSGAACRCHSGDAARAIPAEPPGSPSGKLPATVNPPPARRRIHIQHRQTWLLVPPSATAPRQSPSVSRDRPHGLARFGGGSRPPPSFFESGMRFRANSILTGSPRLPAPVTERRDSPTGAPVALCHCQRRLFQPALFFIRRPRRPETLSP